MIFRHTYIYTCTALACLLLAGLGFIARKSYLRPVISVEKNVVDFGALTVGDQTERTIFISNHGKSQLTIKSIIASCSCLSGRIDKHALLPNEKTSLTIILSETAPHPTQSTNLVLITNDPVNPYAKIATLSICHPSSITFNSRIVDMGRIPRGKLPVQQRASILLPSNTKYQDIIAEIASGDLASASVKVLPGPEGESHAAIIIIEINSDAHSGHSHWKVRVKKKESDIGDVVTFKANVIDDLRASPAFIVMKARNQSTHETDVKVVRRSDGASVRFESVSMSENIAFWTNAAMYGDAVVVTFSTTPDTHTHVPLSFGKRIQGSLELKMRDMEHPINLPIEIWP